MREHIVRDRFIISEPNIYHPRTIKLILVKDGFWCVAWLSVQEYCRYPESIEHARFHMDMHIEKRLKPSKLSKDIAELVAQRA